MLGMMRKRGRTTRAAAAALLLLPVVACTGESGTGPKGAEPSPTSTGSAPSLRERAAPYDLAYRQVAGKLPRGERERLLRAITRPVRAWAAGGFVDGPWPRRRFKPAFSPFTRDITGTARQDARLLTMYAVAPSLVDVVPLRRRVRLSVTVPRDRPVGATASVDLRFLGLTDRSRRVRVSVRGDLYLSRPDARGWQIFGYDVDRWVERGAMIDGGGA